MRIPFVSVEFGRYIPLFSFMNRKIIGHLFYTTLSFVHHFKSIGRFKLKLQSGNAQFGSKSAIISRVTLKDLGKQQGTSSRLHKAVCIISKSWMNSNCIYSLETLDSGQNRHFLYRVTLKFDGWPWKNNRVHLLTSSIQHQALCIISKP